MRFAHPDWLWALGPALVLLPLFVVWAARSADRARRTLVADDLLVKLARGWSPGRRRAKTILQVVGILLVIFSLAGPRVGSREVTVKRRGIDLIVALDTSASMSAQDIVPSRLGKAKREISAFFDHLDGDRVGLVAFAGDAFLQCPLTLDYGAARMFLEVLDENAVSRPGTNIGAAIRAALAAFPEGDDKFKAIVLVTDGEDHSGTAETDAQDAARRGIHIYTIGVGSVAGEPIPIATDGNRGGGYKKDRRGEIIMTSLDVESLERIALETGGEFHRATTGELELERIYDSLERLGDREVASRSFTQFEERFQIPLGLGLLLLLIDFALPDRVRRKQDWEGRFA
jgi:Ca-activated chloride channel family protein